MSDRADEIAQTLTLAYSGDQGDARIIAAALRSYGDERLEEAAVMMQSEYGASDAIRSLKSKPEIQEGKA